MESVSPVLIWFLLGIFFFVTELILPGFIIFFFGIGAWCVALALAVTNVSLTVQTGLFLISSLLSLILFRSWFRSIFLGDTNQEDDSFNVDTAPSTGVVIEAIEPPGFGRVQYGGSFWKATADKPIPENTVVQILERKNLIVQVCSLHPEKVD